MKGNGFSPNAISYETIVGALLARNENEQAKRLLREMISQELPERGNKDFESVEAILERSFSLLKGPGAVVEAILA
ncbi:hypothetical protein PIB30_043581 [Stylosanthes scabra]|uniref:Pentatricopeptide repeat-containing protein n=1 Tax=Stylosanthes scabra TaxID=79078 RepID=A0ABU6RFL5_9FABA|nr:hypothetical protein [Stylosanthes scabra]